MNTSLHPAGAFDQVYSDFIPVLTGNSPQCPVAAATTAQKEIELVHAKLGVVSSLYTSLRAKHGPAAMHSLRVALWASAWGVHNQIPDQQMQLIETVGLLHEIGKIGIPDRVLQKPEQLNANEQAMMDLHTQVGLEILRSAGASDELLLCIAGIGTKYQSHSNIPNDLAPLASRLINVIDAFDSMTVRQVYRAPITREHALAELFRLGGSQFDPVLVRSFAELVLAPHLEAHEAARQRWVTNLDSKGNSRLFFLDDQPAPLGSVHGERTASALVHTLNDTFYRHMMDHVQDGVIFIDSECRVLDWNAAAERMTGTSADAVFHQRWSPDLAKLCDTEGFAIQESDCPFHQLMGSGEKTKKRLSIRSSTGNLTHVDVEVVPVLNDEGHLCGGAMILEDISETAVLEQKIVHLRERACQDQLTKVANRGELNRQLPEFVSYHQRVERPGSVIICDIDFFKRINDNFSHQAGDEALIAFAQILKDSCRDSDFVARYGGEEFVMLCGECDFSEAKDVAENIRKRVKRTPIPALRNASMTASFGVSTVLPGDTDETILHRADQGLLIAKESGRDRVVGLGHESKPSNPPEQVAHSPSSSWLSWLAPSPSYVGKFELATSVPSNVTLEKLKGFVREFQASVLHVEQDTVLLELDCRNAPIPQAKNERMGKFRIELKLCDIECETPSRTAALRICTLLEMKIFPSRGRDRRSDAVQRQIHLLKAAFQGFVVASEVDEAFRATILRKIKPERDSRY